MIKQKTATNSLKIAEIRSKKSVVPCFLNASNATKPLVATRALASKVRHAKIPNIAKCGFTCVTSKIFKKTKHNPANPRIQAMKMDKGLRLLNFDVASTITMIGVKHIPENKYVEKL